MLWWPCSPGSVNKAVTGSFYVLWCGKWNLFSQIRFLNYNFSREVWNSDQCLPQRKCVDRIFPPWSHKAYLPDCTPGSCSTPRKKSSNLDTHLHSIRCAYCHKEMNVKIAAHITLRASNESWSLSCLGKIQIFPVMSETVSASTPGLDESRKHHATDPKHIKCKAMNDTNNLSHIVHMLDPNERLPQFYTS